MKLLQTCRLVSVLAAVFSVVLCCSEKLQADWVLVQNQPVRIYRDTRTGLEWSVTLDSADHDHDYARQLVAQYGLRLPTWDELRDVVNNSGGINQLNIKKGYTDLYETSDPDVLAGAYGGSISTKRPRMPLLTQSWVIGVRRSSGNSQSNGNSHSGGGGGFRPGQIINPEYGDRITHINNIPIQDTDHFSQIIRNADTHITYTLIDKRTGNAYIFAADLLPKGSPSRLGIYIHNDSRGGVMVTGVMANSPGMNSRFVGNGNGYTQNTNTGGGNWSDAMYYPENDDRIIYVNNIRIQDEAHFRQVIRDSDTRVVLTIVDHRTGNTYKMMTDLWPQGSTTRLGIYITDDSRGGVRVTGTMQGTPGRKCRYLVNGNDAPTTPIQSDVGKLYVLTVWGTNAEDLRKYGVYFKEAFDRSMWTAGIGPYNNSVNTQGENTIDPVTNQRMDRVDFLAYYKSLSGNEASNANVLRYCREISQRAQKNDVIFVYFCCHGNTMNINGDNKRYHVLFPEIYGRDEMSRAENGITRTDIINALNPDAHRLTVLITDTCTKRQDQFTENVPYRLPSPALMGPQVTNLWLLLRTNKGFINWSSTSPLGGFDEDGELSIILPPTGPVNSDGRVTGMPFGVFYSAFHYAFRPNTGNSLSSSEFFYNLREAQYSAYQEAKQNAGRSARRSDMFRNQNTQTLFDFKEVGYVTQ